MLRYHTAGESHGEALVAVIGARPVTLALVRVVHARRRVARIAEHDVDAVAGATDLGPVLESPAVVEALVIVVGRPRPGAPLLAGALLPQLHPALRGRDVGCSVLD